MKPSIFFFPLHQNQIDLFLDLLNQNVEDITLNELISDEIDRDDIIHLISYGYLKKVGDKIVLPTKFELVALMLEQEFRYYTSKMDKNNELNYLKEIKNYLSTVQKQLAHVDTESRKSFLNLRTLVDKISTQGKKHLDIAFKKALDRNSETGEWVSIPHISPVGLYEPIEDLKHTFRIIIDELENSLKLLMDEYANQTRVNLDKMSQNLEKKFENIDINNLSNQNIQEIYNKEIDQLNQALEEYKQKLDGETKKFSEEVLIALNEQTNLLEKNLGKDLLQQFDAIERLNDLKPERIWIMLEETRTELIVHLNNVYTRILREINTLQLEVDISKVGLILTNEAGKAIKRVNKMQRDTSIHLEQLRNIIQQVEDLS